MSRAAVFRPVSAWPLLLVGLSALAGSVALPWRNSHVAVGPYSQWVPGDCSISYDGFSYCETGSVAFGTQTSIAGPVAGTQLAIRVIAVLVVLLAVAAYRTRRRELLVTVVGLGVFGFFAGGAVITSGRVLWIVALAVIVAALGQAGISTSPITSRRRSTVTAP